MITRTHISGDTASTALYSACEGYRYVLSRTWNPGEPTVLFVMLNPSTASELRNDPTIARCEGRARDWGYGGYTICNLFAWRATRPADLRKAPEPVGPENDRILTESADRADRIICAWGVHGAFLSRGIEIARLLTEAGHPLFHLGLTRDGHPRHPLYLPRDTVPEVWTTDPAEGSADLRQQP